MWRWLACLACLALTLVSIYRGEPSWVVACWAWSAGLWFSGALHWHTDQHIKKGWEDLERRIESRGNR